MSFQRSRLNMSLDQLSLRIKRSLFPRRARLMRERSECSCITHQSKGFRERPGFYESSDSGLHISSVLQQDSSSFEMSSLLFQPICRFSPSVLNARRKKEEGDEPDTSIARLLISAPVRFPSDNASVKNSCQQFARS
jgi:hypothetical protein